VAKTDNAIYVPGLRMDFLRKEPRSSRCAVPWFKATLVRLL